ncbi:MAG: O-methyltransferase [bacterium]|nr:O-methyltransferase [bacterium]
MKIVNEEIERYFEALLPDRDSVFLDLEQRSVREGFPAVGPQVGMLLKLLAQSINARQIFELGSGYGYSALWLAQGLTAGGVITLTDSSEENLQMARSNLQRLNLADKAVFKVGNAVELFRGESGPFDLVFNDVDKEAYVEVLELAYQRLRQGGLFVTDNTLWDGKVTEANPDTTTTAIMEFNRRLMEHRGFHTVQLPLRDGVSVSIKR